MPTFYKKTSRVGRSVSGRTFSRPKKTAAKKVAKAKSQASVSSSHKQDIKKKSVDSIDSLNQLLEADVTAKKRAKVDDSSVPEIEIDAFDGLTDADEAREMYERVVDYEKDKTKSVEAKVHKLEAEKDEEKRELERQIRELKRELHRTAPLHDTKFFSLTKELSSAISDLNRVVDQTGVPLAKTSNQPRVQPLSSDSLVTAPPVARQVEKPVSPPPQAPAVVAVQENKAETKPVEEPKVKKNLSKKKVLVTGITAVLVVGVISGVISTAFMSSSKVDQALVEEYLAQAQTEEGAVQGVQTNSSEPTKTADPSQADVTFDATVWENYDDGQFGVTMQYPKNAVKFIRTDSSVTFIRKTGYLFKIQRIETSLTLEEYWKQIQATSLNYAVSEEKFKGKDALKLELEDLTDYPGDRYLLKVGNFIYDVWYATPSNNFDADDIKRAEKMLASFSVVETEDANAQ